MFDNESVESNSEIIVMQDDRKDKPKNILDQVTSVKQLILFLVGFLGLTILGTISSEIAIAIGRNNGWIVDNVWIDLVKQTLCSAIINTTCFTIIGGVSLIIIGKLGINLLLKQFTKFDTYIRGIGLGLVVVGVSMIVGNIMILIFGDFPTNSNEKSVDNFITTYKIIGFIVVVILGPVVEELAYRLGLFGLIKRKSRVAAYIVTILVFALIHMNFSSETDIKAELLSLPTYIAMSSILCFAYDENDSLGTSIMAHMTNNFISYFVLVILPMILGTSE